MSATQQLGVITNNPNDVFQRDVIAGLREVAQQRGYDVQVLTVQDAARDFERIAAQAHILAGALVITNVLPDDQLAALHQQGLPVSLISHHVPALPIPGIISNNRQGIAILMQHLVIDCKRTRPVFIRGDMRQNDAVQRAVALEHEMMRYNLTLDPRSVIDGDFIPSLAGERFRAFLQAAPAFDSVIAADYLMGVEALRALRDSGYRVPQDVVVAGFGDGMEAEAAGLTTVAADIVALGRCGTRQLLGQIEGLNIQGVTMMSTNLIVRDTTC